MGVGIPAMYEIFIQGEKNDLLYRVPKVAGKSKISTYGSIEF